MKTASAIPWPIPLLPAFYNLLLVFVVQYCTYGIGNLFLLSFLVFTYLLTVVLNISN